jgi:predicted NAD-dependent protein-ADP-ribosyltransferase YbiA (DUF1768 family)
LIFLFFNNFYSGKKEFRSLSNFYECDILIDNRLYQTGEHAFHGEKYFRLGVECDDVCRKNELLEYSNKFLKSSIFETPNIAKKMGGKKSVLMFNMIFQNINLIHANRLNYI